MLIPPPKLSVTMPPGATEVEALPTHVSKLASLNGAAKELKSSASPLPEVKSFDARTVTVDELVAALRLAGGVVVKNAISVEEAKEIERDVRPWLDKDKAWENGEFFPKETRRAFGLASKSPTFATKVIGNPLWLGVTDAVRMIKYDVELVSLCRSRMCRS